MGIDHGFDRAMQRLALAVGTEQHVAAPGHVLEMVRPGVACGVEGGYIVRRQSEMAVCGCTCGFYEEGPTADVDAALRAHLQVVAVDV